MKAAPLKGDCLICQAPAPTRDAINAAIWPEDGTARSVTYRADAVKVAKASKVPELAGLNVKTVTRHCEHVEASWRVLGPNDRLRDDEIPISTDFGSVMERGSRLGMKAMAVVEDAIDVLGPVAFAFYPKEMISIAKLGIGASSTKEASRLKGNQQVIDVMAIFAAGSGHLPSSELHDEEAAVSLEELRAEIATERKLLAARSGSADDESLPPDVAAAATARK